MIHDKTADATAALHRAVQQQQDRHDSATPSAPVDEPARCKPAHAATPVYPCRRNTWTSRAWKPT